jgi:hypothetical protein
MSDHKVMKQIVTSEEDGKRGNTEPSEEKQLFYLYVEYARALQKANRLRDAEEMYVNATDMIDTQQEQKKEGQQEEQDDKREKGLVKRSLQGGVLDIPPAYQATIYSEYADVLTARADHLAALPVYCKAHSLLKHALLSPVQTLLDKKAPRDDESMTMRLDITTRSYKQLLSVKEKRRKRAREDNSRDNSDDKGNNYIESSNKGEGEGEGEGGVVLTEAACASIAAAVSTFLFYPLEVLRTRTQAQGGGGGEGGGGGAPSVLLSLLLAEYVNYAVFLRVGYIFLCSFLYVFIFEFLKRRLLLGEGSAAAAPAASFSWLVHFCCSGVACLLTVLMTQAVDSNIYRSQVSEVDVCLWGEVFSPTGQSLLLSVPASATRAVWCEVSLSLSGILPSLFLCINPALYYTLFDGLKWKFLQRCRQNLNNKHKHTHKKDDDNDKSKGIQGAEGEEGVEGEGGQRRLTGAEAFVVGFVSKTLSTLLTYPFIRAKVLMVTRAEPESCSSSSDTGTGGVCTVSAPPSSSLSLSSPSSSPSSSPAGSLAVSLLEALLAAALSFELFRVMAAVARREGVAGWWQGLGLHVLHASLRDALSMVSKEHRG